MDQCKKCTAKGDLERCMNTQCNIHDSWHTEQLREIVGVLQKDNDYLKKLIWYINKGITR